MTKFELLASGFGAVEGPTIDDHGCLYFSDVYDGGVYRLNPNRRVDTIVPRRKATGGICLHADGGIVVAGRDISLVADGHSEVLLAREDLDANPNYASSFNDLGADAKGRIFAGTIRRNATGDVEDCDLVSISVRREGQSVYGGIGLPNGVVTSPDGRWLYHADTDAKAIAVVDLDASVPEVVRTISTAALPGGPDGMAMDEAGYLWVALYQGGQVARITPEGGVDRTISVPANSPLSVCFMGADLEDLIVVTMDSSDDPRLRGCVLKTSAGVRGAEVPRARI
jgi:gluconolactonase